MLDFLINHWLALLLIMVALVLLLGFAWLALVAAVWRKSDEIDERFD